MTGSPAGHLLLLELPVEGAEAAAGLLHLGGAAGVELLDGEGLPPPGEAAPPPGFARLRGCFLTLSDAEAAQLVLERRLGVRPTLVPIPGQAWAESWKSHFHPLRIGRIEVIPPWETGRNRPEGTHRLVLEPGMAFGTGSHETTSLCLRALDLALRDRPGSSVLDVGTGTGILALAAALLGASPVEATDNDPIAVRVALENAAQNGLADQVRIRAAPLDAIAQTFDVVVANILANTLVEGASMLRARVARNGLLLLSGILVSQADEVARAFASPAFAELARQDDGDWLLLAFRRVA